MAQFHTTICIISYSVLISISVNKFNLKSMNDIYILKYSYLPKVKVPSGNEHNQAKPTYEEQDEHHQPVLLPLLALLDKLFWFVGEDTFVWASFRGTIGVSTRWSKRWTTSFNFDDGDVAIDKRLFEILLHGSASAMMIFFFLISTISTTLSSSSLDSFMRLSVLWGGRGGVLSSSLLKAKGSGELLEPNLFKSNCQEPWKYKKYLKLSRQ